MNITKAIIPVAGYGTRRLPITKSIEKCMLPIGNRPVIDYVVEDCIRAGINQIYFVTNKSADQIKSFYGHNTDLENFLESRGKTDMLSQIYPPDGVEFFFAVQENQNGNAAAVAIAIEQFGIDEDVLIAMGDDLFYRPDGGSEVADLIARHKAGNITMLGAPAAEHDERKYGFFELDGDKLIRIAEAVTVDKAPSNLFNVNRYIVPPEFLRNVVDYSKSETTEPEYYITTVPFDNFIKNGGTVRVMPAKGEYLDGGSLEGWLHANQVINTRH
jgi:UTP--glucose-1-phosphate uridylyltransferase